MTEKEPSGRLIEFRVANFQRIKAVRIRPDGHVITIAGRNDQGKTSLLRAVWVLLAGMAAAPSRVIREGEEECTLAGDFGELKVQRTFRRSKDGGDVTMSLKVTEADGTPVKGKVQGTLDKLLGAYAFDPLAFARAPAKVQYDTLKALVPGFDFEANAAERKRAFEGRTDVNRRLDQEKAAAAAIQLPPGACPKEIDVTAQLDAIAKANKENSDHALEERRRVELRRDIDLLRAQAQKERERAAKLREEAAQLDKAVASIDQQVADGQEGLQGLPPIPPEVDITPIRAKIGEAEKVKATRALFAQRTRHEDSIEEFEAQAATLSESIKIFDEAKAAAIATAKMPVKGLGFGDNEVLLNGIPFEQAGTRVKILTSTMIAMALNPKLRVMTIDEGSEIDKEGMALLEQLAEQHDFTVLVARVDERGANGFLMENGELVEVEEKVA